MVAQAKPAFYGRRSFWTHTSYDVLQKYLAVYVCEHSGEAGHKPFEINAEWIDSQDCSLADVVPPDTERHCQFVTTSIPNPWSFASWSLSSDGYLSWFCGAGRMCEYGDCEKVKWHLDDRSLIWSDADSTSWRYIQIDCSEGEEREIITVDAATAHGSCLGSERIAHLGGW